jgi:hypothetical protein
MEHLRACGACRDVYDGVAEAEHGLAGGAGALGVPALERVGARLQSDLAAAAPRRFAWMRWAAAAATAASVIVAVRVAWVPDDGGFTARGGAADDGVGIRLFRLAATGAEELGDGASVGLNDEIGATVSSGPYGQVVLSVRGSGSTTLAQITESIPRGVIDEPMEGTLRLTDVPPGIVIVDVTFTSPSSATAPPVAARAMRLRLEAEAPR